MLKPHAQPVYFEHHREDWWDSWLQERKVAQGDQVAWLAANIRDTDFFHRTALTDLWSPDEGVIEWILDQPECSMGTALHIYLSAMHFNPRDIAEQKWNMTSLHWPRHGAMKLQAAKGLREGRYAPVVYAPETGGGGPRGDNPAMPDEILFEMIRDLPEDHPMRIPTRVLDMKSNRVAHNYYDWEYDDACFTFVESFASYSLKKQMDMVRPSRPKQRETRNQRSQRNRQTAEVLGVMALGIAASFLKGRR